MLRGILDRMASESAPPASEQDLVSLLKEARELSRIACRLEPIENRPPAEGSRSPRYRTSRAGPCDAWPSLHYAKAKGALLLSPSPLRIPPAQLRFVDRLPTLHTCHPTHSAFQWSTAAKVQTQPSSTVNTRTPSVPHIT